MARILILTPQLPYPPHQGTSLRNFNIIKGLADKHRISLISFLETDQSVAEEKIAPLLEICETLITIPVPEHRSTFARLKQMFFSKQPDLALRLKSDRFAQSLEIYLKNNAIDILQVEGIEMAWTIDLIKIIDQKVKIVFDAHNAEATLQKRAMEADISNPVRWPYVIYSWIQTRRLSLLETKVCNEVDWVTAVSKSDEATLQSQSRFADIPITVIPNCIDVLEYQAQNSMPAQVINSDISFDLVFSGKMDYRPNVDAVLWFAQKVWPLIIASRPETTWVIVGQKPHKRLDKIENMPGIKITGWVNSVQPYLDNARVFIMPFRVGSGTRLKLIEAFASGKAVVSTPVGAEGFPVHNGRELLLTSNPEDMAGSIIRLLGDPTLRQKLGLAGQKFAQNYDWRVVIPQFDAIYETLLE